MNVRPNWAFGQLETKWFWNPINAVGRYGNVHAIVGDTVM